MFPRRSTMRPCWSQWPPLERWCKLQWSVFTVRLGFMRIFCNFSTHTHSLIILDKIDQLDKKEILYTLFEWSTLTNSRLILIGESEGQTCTCYSHAPLPFKYINSCDTVFNSCDTVYVIGIARVCPNFQHVNTNGDTHCSCPQTRWKCSSLAVVLA